MNEVEDPLEIARDLKAKLEEKLHVEKAYDLEGVLKSCDQEIWLRCSECHARKRGFTRCKKRWCPICARKLAAERTAKYERAVRAMKWPLHVTLTIKNTHDLTRSTLTTLLRTFRRLRQRRLWKLTVRGGFVSLELTNRGKGWHPHLHVLCDVEWLSLLTCPPRKSDSRERRHHKCQQAAAELSDTWAELVNQKTASVKTRRCAGPLAAREVMKYSVKAGDLIDCKGRASDVIHAMKATRLFRGFGSCYRLKLDGEETKRVCTCEACGEPSTMIPEDVLANSHEKWIRSRRAA